MSQLILQNLFSFILITSFIVFVHEFGHFIVARFCGVKVEIFSIGFGKELFGFRDKKNTRWKFCLLPFGGYVKMFGDKNAASTPDFKALAQMNDTEKKQAFIFKNVYQRIAIVFAGPFANFILAIFIFTILFRVNGLNIALPIINEVLPQSAAFEADLKPNDKILKINEKEISDFSQMQQIVALSANKKLQFEILRNEKIIQKEITPKFSERKNIFGETTKIGLLGISSLEISHQNLNIFQAFYHANIETYNLTKSILNALGDLITGNRSLKELSGPIKIAKYSGKSVEIGLMMTLWFMAMISLNLGVMNLLPLPMLDGGHLLFYFIEIIYGKELPQKTQQIAFAFGLSIILTLMLFTTYNDITQLILG